MILFPLCELWIKKKKINNICIPIVTIIILGVYQFIKKKSYSLFCVKTTRFVKGMDNGGFSLFFFFAKMRFPGLLCLTALGFFYPYIFLVIVKMCWIQYGVFIAIRNRFSHFVGGIFRCYKYFPGPRHSSSTSTGDFIDCR